jgi:hypothetical protein
MIARKLAQLLALSKRFFSISLLLGGLLSGWGLATPATAAEPPQLFFDTEIVSMSLTGGPFPLPLGQFWSEVDTTVGVTKAQDHNSSRSNKTASIISPGDPNAPDPIDPNALDGTDYQIDSFFDVFFDLTFDSPFLSTTYGGGGPIVLEGEEAAQLVRVPSSPYTFDKTAPDFGMLSSSDNQNRALEHRGHVTVLKIAMGGDEDGDALEDELTILSDGIIMNTVPGSDEYSILPDGSIYHTFDTTMFITGSIGDANSSIPFTLGPLFGSIAEIGQLSNALVPEPGSLVLLALGGLLGWGRRRRG